MNIVGLISVIGILVYGAFACVDFVESITFTEIYDRALEGESTSQLMLGMLYHKGELSVVPNRELAIKWYETAARNGSKSARLILCEDFDRCDQ